jgi:hypothetical protein
VAKVLSTLYDASEGKAPMARRYLEAQRVPIFPQALPWAVAILAACLFTFSWANTVQAVEVCTNDSAGANDVPGQKDLTRGCVDKAGLPTTLPVKWNWDETSFTGGNTGDACSLFDSNGNGHADYALCVTIGGNPATQQPGSPRLFICNNTRSDRCASSTQILSPFASTCSVSQQNTQPFPSGDNTPVDT